MRDAPERIWIEPQDNRRWYREQAIVAPEGEVEYVRAGLAAPQPPADVREVLSAIVTAARTSWASGATIATAPLSEHIADAILPSGLVVPAPMR